MSNSSKIILISVIIIAVVAGFGAGYISSQAVSGTGIFQPKPTVHTGNLTQEDTIGVINEAWRYLEREYVEPAKLASENVSASAIKGIIDALQDPHMAYITADEFKIVQNLFSGSFEGIGAVVGIRDDKLTIAAVMKGTPAEASGILTGDIIEAIDGESTEGISVDIAVSKIRGDAGTIVNLLILHPDAAEPVTISITRAKIDVPSVDYALSGDIAIISVYQFSLRTADELAEILPKLKEDNVKGIVLDLRDNPGGVLDTVINVASFFITDGTIISVESNQGVVQTYEAVKQDITTDLPMVVLVNENSASGSEVLSGALQDHHRALIAGTTTYGKGSVNYVQPLSNGTGIYITISRWVTPDGNIIEGKGIQPDITLDITGEEEMQWALDYLNK